MNSFDEGGNILTRAFVPIPGTGDALAPSDVDSLLGIDLAIYDGATSVYALSGLATLGILSGTSGWQYDDRGYNFSHSVPGGAYDFIGGKSYRIEYTIHTNVYGAISVDVTATCVGRRSA